MPCRSQTELDETIKHVNESHCTMVDGIDDEGILLPVTCYCAKSAAAGAGDVDAADAGNVADLAIGNRLPEVL